MITRKFTIEVTERQLADLITCLHHCINRELGYGHQTLQEDALSEANRKRLLMKLEQIGDVS